MNTYTVVGYWLNDGAVPCGVIAGQHDVTGGEDLTGEGLWATSVQADDAEAAESAAVAEMETGRDDEGEDEQVRGCSCGMADYGAPGHDGGPPLPDPHPGDEHLCDEECGDDTHPRDGRITGRAAPHGKDRPA